MIFSTTNNMNNCGKVAKKEKRGQEGMQDINKREREMKRCASVKEYTDMWCVIKKKPLTKKKEETKRKRREKLCCAGNVCVCVC